jgi:hypothetical protein
MRFFFLLLHAALSAPTFFVSPSGSDANPGTLAQPFETPARGAAALLAACGGGACALSGASLTLRGGEYALRAPLSLSGLRGASGAPILLRAFDGERARLVGSARLAFAPPRRGDAAHAALLRRLSPHAAARVLVAAAPPGVNFSGGGELLWQDVPQVAARWPDDVVANAWAARDARGAAAASAACAASAPPLSAEPFFCAGWARTVPADNWTWDRVRVSAAAPFAGWTPPWSLRGLFTYDWAEAASTVARFDAANGTALFAQGTWSDAGYWGGARYIAENAPEALTAAGEYYVDAAGARVWWLPPDDVPAAGTSAAAFSQASELLSVVDSAHVAVADLLLSGSVGPLLLIANSSDVVVGGCALLGAGSRAIDAHSGGNAGVVVRGNVIAHCGADCVWVTGGDASALRPSRAIVEDNVILNFGRRGFAFNPAVGIDGVGTVLSHNLAAGGPACGLMFSGALQVVEGNIVADALRATFDMGAVCTGPRDWSAAGPRLAGNALIANGFTPLLANHVSDPLRVGFYLDYGNNAHAVEGNLVWQPPHPLTPPPLLVPRALATRAWGVYNHGGRNAPVSRNLFVAINGSLANGGGLEGGDRAQLANGSHYFASLETCGGHASGGWRAPPCAALPGVPALLPYAPPGGASACAAAASACGAAPFNNSAVSNALPLLPRGGVAAQGPAEPVPFLAANNSAAPDASFFAAGSDFAAELNFTLAPGAAPLGLGFAQLDTEGWGPRWLAPGAWRSVLWGFVPWAVGGGGKGAFAVEPRAPEWWGAVARRCGAGACAGAPRA